VDCPTCGERLRTTEKYQVEMDICPGCKGVWLERGSLDKLVQNASTSSPQKQSGDYDGYQSSHDDHERDQHGSKGKPAKKKGGLLGNIMDSFGGGDD
jgi:Zn-finger nucleic acid-binding protein